MNSSPSETPIGREAGSRRRGCDRSHKRGGRNRALLLRLDETEYALLVAAAQQSGLTPTGYAAEAALACAGASTPPATDSVRAVLLELVRLRHQLRQATAGLRGIQPRPEVTGTAPVVFLHVIRVLDDAVARIDASAEQLTRNTGSPAGLAWSEAIETTQASGSPGRSSARCIRRYRTVSCVAGSTLRSPSGHRCP